MAPLGGWFSPPATPPEPTVRLAVKGDWGEGGAAQTAVSRRICREHRWAPFAAVVTTGDNFSRPDGVATAANYQRPERCILAADIPYVATWGNHDLLGEDTATVLGAVERYYVRVLGPLRLVVLDANRPTDADQLAFLERELAVEHDGPRIAVMHQPLRSAGYHAPSSEQQALWEGRLRAAAVPLVLQGHNHAYERIEHAGITYITTGGGGARVYPCLRRPEGLAVCRPRHHFLALEATRARLTVSAIAPDGDLLDRVEISVPARP